MRWAFAAGCGLLLASCQSLELANAAARVADPLEEREMDCAMDERAFLDCEIVEPGEDRTDPIWEADPDNWTKEA